MLPSHSDLACWFTCVVGKKRFASASGRRTSPSEDRRKFPYDQARNLVWFGVSVGGTDVPLAAGISVLTNLLPDGTPPCFHAPASRAASPLALPCWPRPRPAPRAAKSSTIARGDRPQRSLTTGTRHLAPATGPTTTTPPPAPTSDRSSLPALGWCGWKAVTRRPTRSTVS